MLVVLCLCVDVYVVRFSSFLYLIFCFALFSLIISPVKTKVKALQTSLFREAQLYVLGKNSELKIH